MDKQGKVWTSPPIKVVGEGADRKFIPTATSKSVAVKTYELSGGWTLTFYREVQP